MDISYESALRLSSFFGILVIVMIWEFLAPRRPRPYTRLQRWPSNLALVFLNTALLRWIFPMTAMALAYYGETQDWGLFGVLNWPMWLEVVLVVVLLDLVIYLQHRVFHIVPVLWRFHRMHHADLDLDVTSGSRFHPIEIIMSILIKFGAIRLFGAPALAVLIFEIVLNAAAMFNHGNIRLPEKLDRILRWLIVTPDMHRIHHSTIVKETNSNYGFNLPWWDRIFRTYTAEPERGQLGLEIGLKEYRDPKDLALHRLLLIPLHKKNPSA